MRYRRAPLIAIILVIVGLATCLIIIGYGLGTVVNERRQEVAVVQTEKRVPLPRQCAHLLGKYEDWAWNEETDLYPRNHEWATCMKVEYK